MGFVKERETGKRVWEMYDDGEFEQIEERTEDEVVNIIKIYENMVNCIIQNRIKFL
ncbi:MAG: hypothetical protein ACTSV7_09285 [Candidatus Baldrarchaeia archaeon]